MNNAMRGVSQQNREKGMEYKNQRTQDVPAFTAAEAAVNRVSDDPQ